MLLMFSLQVVQQYELAQAAYGSDRRSHESADTQGKSDHQPQNAFMWKYKSAKYQIWQLGPFFYLVE